MPFLRVVMKGADLTMSSQGCEMPMALGPACNHHEKWGANTREPRKPHCLSETASHHSLGSVRKRRSQWSGVRELLSDATAVPSRESLGSWSDSGLGEHSDSCWVQALEGKSSSSKGSGLEPHPAAAGDSVALFYSAWEMQPRIHWGGCGWSSSFLWFYQLQQSFPGSPGCNSTDHTSLVWKDQEL